jgi:hypothetical protein
MISLNDVGTRCGGAEPDWPKRIGVKDGLAPGSSGQDHTMSAVPVQSSSAPGASIDAATGHTGEARTPLCFVIDTDASIRQFLSLVLHGAGIDTEEFPDGNGLRTALARRVPNLVFLDIPLESAEAIACVVALGSANYRGQVQLMSGRGSAVLAHVKSIGDQHRLQMLPALRKPFETNAVLKLLEDLKLGHPPAGSISTKRWPITGSSSGTNPKSTCAKSN